MLSSANADGNPSWLIQRGTAIQEMLYEIRETIAQHRNDLARRGLQYPETIDDIIHLAHLVEMPPERLEAMDYTLGEVVWYAIVWADRESYKATLIASRLHAMLTAATAPPTPAPTADPFAGLRRFARDHLKKQQRAVLEALCDHHGELPLETVQRICDWQEPTTDSWNSLRRRLNEKLRPLGWAIQTFNATARLAELRP